MIPLHKMHWKQQLRSNLTSFDQLADRLQLNEEQRSRCVPKSHFIVNVPSRLLDRMEKGRIDDPLFLQFVPLIEEEHKDTSFFTDPLHEQDYLQSPKLLKKYHGRALLMTTSACAMHCRYCFRRHFPYESGTRDYSSEIAAIAADSSIHEVILSGGDPLSLDDVVLEQLIQDLSSIEHVQMIRFHTRFPVGIPSRVDESFLSILDRCPTSMVFVLHVNHPNELGDDLFDALKPIQKRGIPILAQTVLLKGVNDSIEVLRDLFLSLVAQGILPYYLHQLDRVSGAAHFEVVKEEGKELIKSLRNSLPGYAVPKYVEEVPGELSKLGVV